MPDDERDREQQPGGDRIAEEPRRPAQAVDQRPWVTSVRDPPAKAEREPPPHPVPWPGQRQQRRGDEQQEHVLEHVRPLELFGPIVDRRCEGHDDGREPGDEGGHSPAAGCGWLRPHPAAAQPVEPCGEDHPEERRVGGPAQGQRRRGHGSEQVEDRPGEHPDARQQAPVERRVGQPGRHGCLLRASIAHPFGEEDLDPVHGEEHEDDEEERSSR